MTEILRFEQVSNDRLFDLSFSIIKGQYVTLIGPSGAGKSSLLLLINRLEDPTNGHIFYQNKPLKDYPIIDIRKRIGMVFQSTSLFDGTVAENIRYGPKLHNREWNETKSKELLDAVQLPQSFLNKPIEELSGGEQQRVSLARTLANEPEMLLLDEVTSALDLRNVELIEQLLKGLQQKGRTIIMVTHDVEQAKRLGSYSLFLHEGRIVEKGETNELFEQPKTEALQQFLINGLKDRRG
ncbi:ABC transporter ATP-binding protein [Halalkalibacterium ligniniphilum]|uniref:ABC transporter ATP-binding protein n=1 Tax=Halalkalibacterium ligniniphilum TaxID=1134413 RepID=UPI000380C13F|nr:phosphate ABC transporter ATP-binding protein [Halalkalibacterium ligniniphilum]